MGCPAFPGIPSAGHVADNGFWHPGAEETCPKTPCREDRETFPRSEGGKGVMVIPRRDFPPTNPLNRVEGPSVGTGVDKATPGARWFLDLEDATLGEPDNFSYLGVCESDDRGDDDGRSTGSGPATHRPPGSNGWCRAAVRRRDLRDGHGDDLPDSDAHRPGLDVSGRVCRGQAQGVWSVLSPVIFPATGQIEKSH